MSAYLRGCVICGHLFRCFVHLSVVIHPWLSVSLPLSRCVGRLSAAQMSRQSWTDGRTDERPTARVHTRMVVRGWNDACPHTQHIYESLCPSGSCYFFARNVTRQSRYVTFSTESNIRHPKEGVHPFSIRYLDPAGGRSYKSAGRETDLCRSRPDSTFPNGTWRDKQKVISRLSGRLFLRS